jgi:ACS family sodium-dependent inorganic phosphate cotransporter-like MFS transporter 5
LNGTILGTVIGLTSTAFLSSIEGLGWESSFYIFGFIGLFWCWIWFMIASDTPGNNDWISSFEKNYISFSLQSSTPSSHTPFPFKKAFKTSAVWAVIIAHFCYGWGLYTILNDLPLFLSEVLHLSVKSTALFSSLPQVICWLTGLGLPILADVLIENNFSRTTVRKIFQATCFIGGATVIILIAILGYLNQWIVLILLVLNSIFNAFQNCGLGCAHLDMAAQHAGTLFGITNTFGNLPGFLVPITVGILTQNDPHDRASWYWVWFIMAIFMSFGAVIFVVFGDMRPAKWAVEEDENSDNSIRRETNGRLLGENNGISGPISENDEDLVSS